MERKSGFYWVKYGEVWEPAWYSDNSVTWFFWGVPCGYKDSDMELINPNRIMSPDEWE